MKKRWLIFCMAALLVLAGCAKDAQEPVLQEPEAAVGKRFRWKRNAEIRRVRERGDRECRRRSTESGKKFIVKY